MKVLSTQIMHIHNYSMIGKEVTWDNHWTVKITSQNLQEIRWLGQRLLEAGQGLLGNTILIFKLKQTLQCNLAHKEKQKHSIISETQNTYQVGFLSPFQLVYMTLSVIYCCVINHFETQCPNRTFFFFFQLIILWIISLGQADQDSFSTVFGRAHSCICGQLLTLWSVNRLPWGWFTQMASPTFLGVTVIGEGTSVLLHWSHPLAGKPEFVHMPAGLQKQ